MIEDEFKRFEEKQKLSNLQIDKRLVNLEIGLDEIKTELEALSIPKGIEDKVSKIEDELRHVREEFRKVHEEEKQEREEVKNLTKKYDIKTVKNDFEVLMDEFVSLKHKVKAVENLDAKLSMLNNLQQQLISMERRGKLPQCKEDVEQVNINMKILEERLGRFERGMNQLQYQINHLRSVQPTIIE